MITEKQIEKIKQLVYASTRYDNPQEKGNFPNPAVVDKLIEMETVRYETKLAELNDRKMKLQSDLDLLMNLTEEDIAALSPRTRQWLAHAVPKYGAIVAELEEEDN